MKKLNFCTLFNSNYLSRGLTLYRSLQATCPDFHLYVFAFDTKTYEYLSALKEEKLTVISLKEFEDPELLRVKSSRSAAEYCWTCTSSTILYALKTFQLDHCTYIDADMYFYSDPSVLVQEMNGKSVLITEHRYTKEYDQTATSGKYCVQFVTILNTPEGLEVINWWRNACIEWCYARHEDGKFGDQKYLDDWTTRFSSVHELQHPGGGVAPWNVQQYTFHQQAGKIMGREISTGKKFEVVFFHYHGLKFFDNDVVSLTEAGYAISKEVQELFFIPYVKRLMQAKREVNQLDPGFNPNGSSGRSPYPVSKFKAARRYYLDSIKSGRRYLLGQKVGRLLKQHYFLDAGKL
jgi:hypothetical protein